MSKKNKQREHLKNIAIAVLSVTAILLGFLAGIFDAPIRAQVGGGGGRLLSMEQIGAGVHTPLSPAQIFIHFGHDEGFITAANLEDADIVTLSEDSLPFLQSALQHTLQAEEVLPHVWQETLGSWGLFFTFHSELSLADFAQLLGSTANMPVGKSTMFYLSWKETGVFLYFLGEQNQTFRAPTSVNVPAFSEFISMYSPNGGTISLDLDTQIPVLSLQHYSNFPLVAAQTAHMYQHLELLLARFGFNPSLVRYIESDGVRTMVEEDATLRIFEDGQITYQHQGQNPRLMVGADATPSLPMAIRAAYVLASLVNIVSGDAILSFYNYTYQNGQFVIEFEYMINGIPIRGAYPAARVVIEQNFIREASLFARNFQNTSEVTALLSSYGAQIAAGGQELRLLYIEETPLSNRYVLRWTLTEGQGE